MTQLANAIAQAIREDMSISLDSSALIAYLAGEQPLNDFIKQLFMSEARIVVSTIAASEALVRTVETYGREFAVDVLASLQGAGKLRMVPFGQVQLIETALLRSRTRLKFPDAAIIATAQVAGSIAIIGNDRAWQTKALGIQYIHLDDVVREYEEEARS